MKNSSNIAPTCVRVFQAAYSACEHLVEVYEEGDAERYNTWLREAYLFSVAALALWKSSTEPDKIFAAEEHTNLIRACELLVEAYETANEKRYYTLLEQAYELSIRATLANN